MAVYVDDMQAPFRGMVMCHMLADSTEELLAMADRIGVDRKWIQKEGTGAEHFDISKGKKALAIRHGAIQITWTQAGMLMLERTGKLKAVQAAKLAAWKELWTHGIDTHDDENPASDTQKTLF